MQQRLDGDPVCDQDAIAAHLLLCPSCRAYYQAVQLLEGSLQEVKLARPRPDLTERIVAQVLAERRHALRRRRLAGAVVGMAAGLLLVIVAGRFWPSPSQPDSVVVPLAKNNLIEEERPAPRAPAARTSLLETGEAVVALTRQVAGETLGRTRLLLSPVSVAANLDNDGIFADFIEVPARSMRQVGQGVSAELEPVTDSARRAIDLFLRDLPPATQGNQTGL